MKEVLMDDTTYPPPRQVGATEKSLTLTGMLIPWWRGKPCLIHVYGTVAQVPYLPLFKDEEQLRDTMTKAGIRFDAIKVIHDGQEFLASVSPDIIIAANLRYTPEGRVRYFQVKR